MPEVHIVSYFSFETDLANEMRAWPEFRSGKGYDVELVSSDNAVAVSVTLVEGNEEKPYVRINSPANGPLFDRVLGRAIHALAAHSDYLMFYRIS